MNTTVLRLILMLFNVLAVAYALTYFTGCHTAARTCRAAAGELLSVCDRLDKADPEVPNAD